MSLAYVSQFGSIKDPGENGISRGMSIKSIGAKALGGLQSQVSMGGRASKRVGTRGAEKTQESVGLGGSRKQVRSYSRVHSQAKVLLLILGSPETDTPADLNNNTEYVLSLTKG